MCGWNVYMHGKTTSCRPSLLILGYFAISNLMQYLGLVQIFFSLSFALTTSPSTQAELSSLTVHQHKLKATLYSKVTCAFVCMCLFSVVNIPKSKWWNRNKYKMCYGGDVSEDFIINLFCWSERKNARRCLSIQMRRQIKFRNLTHPPPWFIWAKLPLRQKFIQHLHVKCFPRIFCFKMIRNWSLWFSM